MTTPYNSATVTDVAFHSRHRKGYQSKIVVVHSKGGRCNFLGLLRCGDWRPPWRASRDGPQMVFLTWVGSEERGLGNCNFTLIREVQYKENCYVLQSYSRGSRDVITIIITEPDVSTLIRRWKRSESMLYKTNPPPSPSPRGSCI